MATVGDIQVEIDSALVQNLKELAELVASYSTTNEAQRKRIDELLEALAKANQRAETAEAQRREFEAGYLELARQISSEDDLWVVINGKEMIQLRWHRQKVQL